MHVPSLKLNANLQYTNGKVESLQPSFSPSNPRTLPIKLPVLQIPKFSGNVLEWSSFWDSFETGVHRTDIPTMNKFTYLRSCLSGEAYSCIAGISTSADNYTIAVDLLKSRFGETSRLISAYMKALLELTEPSNTAASIRAFYDKLILYVRSLEGLGKTPDSYGELLIPVLLERLPVTLVQNMTRGRNSTIWSFPNLLICLKNELDILELCNKTAVKPDFEASVFIASGQVDKYPFSSRNCVYCGEKPSSINCIKYDVEAKVKFIRENRLCFNCLRTGHISLNCKSETRCKFCRKKHHSSICVSNNSNSVGSNYHKHTSTQNLQLGSPARSQNHKGQNSSLHKVGPQRNNVYSTPKVDRSTQMHTQCSQRFNNCVLLKTAVIHVLSKDYSTEIGALFDDGFQRTFVNRSLVNLLGLKPIRADQINITGFGGVNSNPQIRSLDVVSLKV
ncbi:uncharacterized protein LOC141914509 [Tubulanus polymorphus]|uniref:uncharacterized protein LOC141914509 n=1 Tax=Tubulanus polymorphus TaxID=672921 RepID=UPI003DA6BCF3